MIRVLFTTLLLFIAFNAMADETIDARSLHQQTCQRCHDDSIYTRPDSIIFSLSALKKRVHFCESMAGAGWSEQQINAVIDYLNQRFYHYKQ
jgi:hypothetical protein